MTGDADKLIENLIQVEEANQKKENTEKTAVMEEPEEDLEEEALAVVLDTEEIPLNEAIVMAAREDSEIKALEEEAAIGEETIPGGEVEAEVLVGVVAEDSRKNSEEFLKDF